MTTQTITPTARSGGLVNRLTGTFTAPGTAITTTSVGWTEIEADSTIGGAGASGVVDIGVGFAPQYVMILNATDRTKYEWFGGMASGTTLKTVAAGTVTLDTGDAGITVVGQVVTFPAAVCIANKVIYWQVAG